MCNQKDPGRELIENAYYHFVDALETLADDAEGQCARLGNFNVAWEIKDDVVRGARVLNLPGSRFASKEREEICALVKLLEAIPNSLLVSTTDPEENLDVMKNPIWAPLRERASYLLYMLAERTRQNRNYFYPDAQ